MQQVMAGRESKIPQVKAKRYSRRAGTGAADADLYCSQMSSQALRSFWASSSDISSSKRAIWQQISHRSLRIARSLHPESLTKSSPHPQ